MQHINLPIIFASVDLAYVGKKVLTIHTQFRPERLHQDECVQLYLTKDNEMYKLPPLPIIQLPQMADINRYTMILNATAADGLQTGDVFQGGHLVGAGRCSRYGPVIHFDPQNLSVGGVAQSFDDESAYYQYSALTRSLPPQ